MLRALVIGVPILLVVYVILANTLPWDQRRTLRHYATYFWGVLGTVVALVPLLMLLGYLFKEGAPGLTAAFFTHAELPDGQPGGGFANAMIGSVMVVGLAALIGVPIGVLAGIYLAEIGRGWVANAIRFLAEVLTGLPSIIAGILAYVLIVMHMGDRPGWSNFNAVAGAIALSFLMIPVITRVTEEAVRMVPAHLREASYGLGATQWRTVWSVVLPAARSGILTGVVLAVARAGGETAPLLFTIQGNRDIVWDPRNAVSALPLSIYNATQSPSDVNLKMAVTGALFLVILVALTNFGIRWFAVRSQPRLG